MTKRQLIDQIVTMNQSAEPSFLAEFDDVELDEYLHHLRLARTAGLSGDVHRYDHYFESSAAVAVAEPPPAATEIAEQENEIDPVDQLDLNVSPDAIFSESVEQPADDIVLDPDSEVDSEETATNAQPESTAGEAEEESESWLF